GCHPDLWPVYGDGLIQKVDELGEEVAASAWSADQVELERWLSSGLIDAALCYSPTLSDTRQEILMFTERRVLVSQTKRPLMRWDPNYIYVDAGEAFRKNHAAAYPDGDTPLKTISSSVWAKGIMLKQGGSGYLPHHLIVDELRSGALHLVEGAPEFSRNAYLVTNKLAMEGWPWIDQLLESVREAALSS
ncbi:MAG: DNA-binding transcriptional LysR family regulator, partial [Parvicella sp.]